MYHNQFSRYFRGTDFAQIQRGKQSRIHSAIIREMMKNPEVIHTDEGAIRDFWGLDSDAVGDTVDEILQSWELNSDVEEDNRLAQEPHSPRTSADDNAGHDSVLVAWGPDIASNDSYDSIEGAWGPAEESPDADQADADLADAEQADAEQADAEQADAEQADAEQADAEQADRE